MAAVKASVTGYQTKAGIRWRVRLTNRRFLKIAHKFNRAGFTREGDAEKYAVRIRAMVERLEAGDVEIGHTLVELINRYVAEALPQLNKKDRVVRIRQLAWWSSHLGGESLLAWISPPRISRALRLLATHAPVHVPRGKLQKRIDNGRTLSSATVNRYRSSLSALFTFAVKDLYWMDENPVHKTRIMKEPAGRVRYLEPEEIRRLGKCIDRRDGHLQLLFWLRP